MLLKIRKIQRKAYVQESFFKQNLRLQVCNFIKKENPTQMFFNKTSFFNKTRPVAASANNHTVNLLLFLILWQRKWEILGGFLSLLKFEYPWKKILIYNEIYGSYEIISEVVLLSQVKCLKKIWRLTMILNLHL